MTIVEFTIPDSEKIYSESMTSLYSQVTITYLAEDASSAYLMIVDTNIGNSDNYILEQDIRN